MRMSRWAALFGATLLLTMFTGAISPAQAVTSYLCPVPFVSQGASVPIPGTNVTVTATANSAVVGDTANTYLYQSNSRISSTLTFSPAVAGLKVVTRFHADAPGAGFEQFDFTGTGGAFTATIRNVNTTQTYERGTTFTGLLGTFGVAYTYDTPVADFARGSYLDLYIACGDAEVETTSQVAFDPALWLQSYGRTAHELCREGWHASWAEWAVDKTGGWVCNRTVFWNGSTWVQNPNAVWGPMNSNQTATWDGS